MPESVSPFRRVVQNSFWLVATETVSRGFTFLVLVYLSRTLTVDGIGVVEFGLAVVTFLQMAATGGANVLGVRVAARSRRPLGSVAGVHLLVTWILFLPLVVVFAVVASWTVESVEMRIAAALFALSGPLVPLGFRWAFIGRERTATLFAGAAGSFAVYLAGCLLFVRGPGDALRVPLVYLGASLLRALVQGSAFVRSFGRLRLRVRRRRLRAWLGAALELTTGSIARSLSYFLDVLVLGVWVSSAEVGEYAVGAKIPLFLCTLAAFVQHAFFPSTSRMVQAHDRAALARVQRIAIQTGLAIAVPGLLCLSLVSAPLMELLFTDALAGSVPFFVMLLWRFPLHAVSGFFRNVIWAQEPALDARIATWGLAASASLVVLGTLLLGTFGAAAGIVLGDFATLGMLVVVAGPSLPPSRVLERAWAGRLALALFAGAIAIDLASRFAPPALVPVGLAAWIGGARLAIGPNLRQLSQALSERGARAERP